MRGGEWVPNYEVTQITTCLKDECPRQPHSYLITQARDSRKWGQDSLTIIYNRLAKYSVQMSQVPSILNYNAQVNCSQIRYIYTLNVSKWCVNVDKWTHQRASKGFLNVMK